MIDTLTDVEMAAIEGNRAALESSELILQFFAFAHLPPHLKNVSAAFAGMAGQLVLTLPRNPERTVALRKLLEAKDAVVRARLYKP